MIGFETYQVDAWTEDCLTIPLRSRASNKKLRKGKDWIFGLAATVAVAITSALSADVTAAAQSGPDRLAVQSAALQVDPDLISEPPAEFWMKAIAEVQRWKRLEPVSFEETPSII